MSTIRAHQDNVILRFLPEATTSPSGLIALPQTKKVDRRGVRRAEVVASGPGYHDRNGRGAFIPNIVQPGDTVLVDAIAGQDFAMDINVPRQNKAAEFSDERGEFRVVRHDEIHARVSGAVISPMRKGLLVRREEVAGKTAAGLFIPDSAKEKPMQGRVMAVGPASVLESGARVESQLRVDDQILFGRYAGTEVTVDGETWLLLKEDDVLGVVEDG